MESWYLGTLRRRSLDGVCFRSPSRVKDGPEGRRHAAGGVGA